MKSSILTLLIMASVLSSAGASSADGTRRYVVVDQSAARAQLPFSDAVQTGNTLYVAGTIGVDLSSAPDPKNARVPSDPAAEARLALDGVKHTLEASGYRMDELVSVQVYCTDLDLYATFNEVYRSYFHDHFPARAFIGVNKLVRGARFEVMGTAVRATK